MKRFIIINLIMLMSIYPIKSKAVSAFVKSSKDYQFTLNIIRKIDIIIQNFPDEANSSSFKSIKELFQGASESFYGANYIDAERKFLKLKDEIRILLIKISESYLTRAKNILDSTAKQSFDSLITFNKGSSLKSYFTKPFNPLTDKKPYTGEYSEKDYHYFYDNETIERYLKRGYKSYYDAKKIYDDPDLAILNAKKRLASQSLDYVIGQYTSVIRYCRQGKQYAIEIYKIRGIHDLPAISKKYNLNTATIEPIFDDRIPQEFKIDAIDNSNLIYTIEQLKLTGSTKNP